MTISKMGSPNTLSATSIDTWQKNAEWKKKNKKHERVLNTTRRGTLPKIAKESRQ